MILTSVGNFTHLLSRVEKYLVCLLWLRADESVKPNHAGASLTQNFQQQRALSFKPFANYCLLELYISKPAMNTFHRYVERLKGLNLEAIKHFSAVLGRIYWEDVCIICLYLLHIHTRHEIFMCSSCPSSHVGLRGNRMKTF